jgi:hypothetical protein
VRPPVAVESKRRQNDYFKLKTDFLFSTYFQVFNQKEGNVVTFWKFVILFKDSHCDLCFLLGDYIFSAG